MSCTLHTYLFHEPDIINIICDIARSTIYERVIYRRHEKTIKDKDFKLLSKTEFGSINYQFSIFNLILLSFNFYFLSNLLVNKNRSKRE